VIPLALLAVGIGIGIYFLIRRRSRTTPPADGAPPASGV